MASMGESKEKTTGDLMIPKKIFSGLMRQKLNFLEGLSDRSNESQQVIFLRQFFDLEE